MDYSIVIWFAGFIVGYLIVRGLRSFWTWGACVALAAGGVSAWGAAGTAYNDGSTTVYFRLTQKSSLDNSCTGPEMAWTAVSEVGAGLSAYLNMPNGYDSQLQVSCVPSPYSWQGIQCWTGWGDSFSYHYAGCSPPTTNQTALLNFTNKFNFNQKFRLRIYQTNGTLAADQEFSVAPGTATWGLTNVLGAGVPFNYWLTGPEHGGEWLKDKTYLQGLSQGGSPSDALPAANIPLSTYVDPGTSRPLPNAPLNTTNIVADRINAQMISDSIGELGQQLLGSSGLGGWGQLSSALTNGTGGESNILEELRRIRTNQQEIASFQSNQVPSLSFWTNSLTTNLMTQAINAASNAISAAWEASAMKGQIHSLTNGKGVAGVAGEASAPGTGVGLGNWKAPLEPLNGNSKTLNMNPFDSVWGTLSSKLVAVFNWVKYWMGVAIVIGVFWAIWNETQAQIEIALITGAQVVIPPLRIDELTAFAASGGTLGTLWIVLKKALAGFLAMFVTVLICTLPSITIFFLINHGYDWWFPQGVVEYTSNTGIGGTGTVLAQMMLTLIWFIQQVVPWTMLVTGVLNVFLSRWWIFSVLLVVCSLLRFMVQAERNPHTLIGFSWVGPMAGFILWGLSAHTAQAAPVQIENLTGNYIFLTNQADGAEYNLKPGDSLYNLEAGVWDCSGGSVTLEAIEGLQILRFTTSGQDTNGMAVISLEYAKAHSSPDIFLEGMFTGLTIFGFAWAVSAFRAGILVRAVGSA